jgi:hypothetical protein
MSGRPHTTLPCRESRIKYLQACQSSPGTPCLRIRGIPDSHARGLAVQERNPKASLEIGKVCSAGKALVHLCPHMKNLSSCTHSFTGWGGC